MSRIKVLFLAASPDRARPLKVGEEFLQIVERLKADRRTADTLELIPCSATTWDDVLDSLKTHQPQVVHFSTHGDDALLMLSGPDGRAEVVGDAGLIGLFRNHHNRGGRVRVVVFNACDSLPLAEAVVPLVDCAIGMNAPIGDDAAIRFAQRFYAALAAGRSVQKAFDEGKTATLSVPYEHGRNLESADGPNPAAVIPELRNRAGVKPSRMVLKSDAPFTVPFRPKGEDFVGRDEDLARLHATLGGSAPVGITGLTGMGGIGKTQLAAEYAHRYRDDYLGGVFWLNAASPLLTEFAALASVLEVEGSEQAFDVRAQRAFEELKRREDALVVFDNLADPALLNSSVVPGCVPSALGCHVLFTTRQRDLGRSFRSIELKILPAAAALQVLLRGLERQPTLDASHPEHEHARAIVRMLGGLPLALTLAGAFLAEYPEIALGDYRERLKQDGLLATIDDEAAQLPAIQLPECHTAAVAATLREQWNALTDEPARLLLRVAGQLPEAAVVPVARLGLLSGLLAKDRPGRPAPLRRALKRLHTASLIEELSEDQLRLHPLVREFAERQTGEETKASFRKDCAARVASAYETYASLENLARTRGIEAMQSDLLTALEFVPSAEDEVNARLQRVLRLLQREAHNLLGWDHKAEPVRFAQQIHYRATVLGLDALKNGAGAQLASCGQPHALLLWRASRESPGLIRTLTGHGGGMSAVAVLDAHHVVSASDDHTIKVWDTASGAVNHTLEGQGGQVNIVAALDAHHVVFASGEGTLKVWDVSSNAVERTLEGHDDQITALAMLDAHRVVFASCDCTLKVWNVSSGAVERTLEGHVGWVTVVAALDAHRVVSASTEGTLKVWDVSSGVVERTLEGHDDQITALAVLDAHRVVFASCDRTLKVWNVSSGAVERTLEGHDDQVTALAVLDAHHVVSASCDRTLKVWNVSSGAVERTLGGHSYWVTAVAVLDAHHLVSASGDGTLKVWNVSSGAVERTLEGHDHQVNALAVLDAHRVVSASGDGTLKVWDVSSGAVERTLEGHSGCVTAVAVLDAHHVVSASSDGMLKVWNVSSGAVERTLVGHYDSVNALAVLDAYHLVSASDDGSLKVWDAASGAVEQTLAGYGGRITTFAVLDGHRVVFASCDRILKVWDVSSGAVERMLKGQGGGVNSMAVLDENHIVSGSDDCTLKVWDVETGQCLATVALDGAITSVAFAEDCAIILAGDRVGTVYALRLMLDK